MSTSQVPASVKQALLEKLHQEIVPELEQLIQQLPDQLVDFGQAETQLRQGMLKVAQHLLERWSQVADLTVRRPCCSQCGVPMRHKGLDGTTVVTTLQEISYRRPRYRCETCCTSCFPHDDVLRFLGHEVSWALAKVCSRQAAQLGSFEEARDIVEEDYGVHLAKETIREIAEAAGQRVLEQEDALRQRIMERQAPLPETAQKPDKACVFADGTTVHTEGSWREIRVMTVTAEDADGRDLGRHSRARFFSVAEVAWSLLLLARGVGYQNARLRAFIADGAHWLWNLADQYFSKAIQILDWYHLVEHVHKAANVLHGEGSEAAKDWAKRLKDELWEGRAPVALETLQAELAKVRSPAKREALQELETYLKNNLGRMDYPRYRELGLPVGSGQVEAQCKTLVGARCKQAGMRNWTRVGAEGILRMRAARQDKTFHALWAQQLRLAA
jgi:Uncharacterised protein family (UPF0236)